MSAFNPDAVMAAFRATITRWRPGIRVWHRASGRRGVVTAYVVCADGAIMIQVAYGDSTVNHYSIELSAVRISEDDEAETWRETEEDEEA